MSKEKEKKVELSQNPDKLKDLRIVKAVEVQKTMNTKGFEILKDEWEKIEQMAHLLLRDENLSPEELKLQQILYIKICEWRMIAQNLVDEGIAATTEEDEPKRFLKRPFAFLGRRS